MTDTPLALRTGGAHLSAPPALSEILVPAGDNAPRWRPGERLNHLFEALAASPHLARADAVLTEAGSVSFLDLDRRANRLARHLMAGSVGPGDAVALIFPRCVDSYVAMLAVHKVNAAYVPLDPSFPADRVAYICADAGVTAILTFDRLAHLGEGAGAAIIRLDSDAAAIAGRDDAPLGADEAGLPASELAYVIYTSGSTGRPKGVPIEHGSIVNFVRVAAETYGYEPGDRVYQGLTLAFDFSVEEIWVPLLAGATLVPNEGGANLVGEDLADFLAERNITALCCVPTLLATMERDLPGLRLLIVSGEACPPDIVRRWHRPGRMILNAYGPTEITVTATVARLAPDEPVTIGVPLPSYSVVITEPGSDRIVPRGETGEIVIGGIGVSPGYLNRPEQTAKAFAADPFGLPHNLSGRIYRSGDLGRIDEAGRLEYQGRIDTQVKIRGYRIEVTEIESQIMQLPGIAQAVVTKHSPGPGIDELAAFYTLAEGAEVSPEEIARALAATLPGFMVPSWYTALATMPMLPSDKADRKALPAPALRLSGRRSGRGEAPGNEAEAVMAAMLGELMGCDPVGVTDDFFDEIGANSLIMARFATRLRRNGGFGPVTMRDFYDRPTIRSLADWLAQGAEAGRPEPPPVAHRRFGPVREWLAGAGQLGLVIGYGALMIWAGFLAVDWTFAVTGTLAIYGHMIVATLGLMLLSWLAPVAVKWLLVGRMRPERFGVYTWRHVRVWFVQALIRANPIRLFAGTPLYNIYLRLLGARVAPSAVVLGMPILVPDLVRIGPRAVVSRRADIAGYRAEAGEIVTGPIEIGADAFVGVGATLDIGTEMGDGAELGHASALVEGQKVPAGARWHGNPGRPTDTRFRRVRHDAPSVLRMVGYNAAALVLPVLAYGPLGIFLFHLVYDTETNSPIEAPPRLFQIGDVVQAMPAIVAVATALFALGVLLGLFSVIVVPRLARAFLTPDKSYRLYGIHHWLIRVVARSSNSRFFNKVFGDSALITGYLARIGYRFDGIYQTGSNFGYTQEQDYPFLCEFGYRVMTSDGIILANAEYSGSHVRLGATRFGGRSYLGNHIYGVPGMALGENVLVGTKTAIPVDGPVQSNTGLLGSPAFRIPRSVERDRQFHVYEDDEDLRQGCLRAKMRHNLVTIGGFLLYHWLAAGLVLTILYAATIAGGNWSPLVLSLSAFLGLLAAIALRAVFDAISLRFRALRPKTCSIYEFGFWEVERHWKLMVFLELNLFSGTPLKPLFLRLLGVRVGRGVFDDGSVISEKTLTEIGDDVTLNRDNQLQAHSLEDGVFKSDRIMIGSGVTLAPHAFVHYGATVGDGAWVAPDSFVMKGETVDAGTWWQGNPATARLAPAGAPAPAAPLPWPGSRAAAARSGPPQLPAAVAAFDAGG